MMGGMGSMGGFGGIKVNSSPQPKESIEVVVEEPTVDDFFRTLMEALEKDEKKVKIVKRKKPINPFSMMMNSMNPFGGSKFPSMMSPMGSGSPFGMPKGNPFMMMG